MPENEVKKLMWWILSIAATLVGGLAVMGIANYTNSQEKTTQVANGAARGVAVLNTRVEHVESDVEELEKALDGMRADASTRHAEQMVVMREILNHVDR